MKINQFIRIELELSNEERELLRKTANFLSQLNGTEGNNNIFNWIIENEVGSLNDFEDVAAILSILSDEDIDFESNL